MSSWGTPKGAASRGSASGKRDCSEIALCRYNQAFSLVIHPTAVIHPKAELGLDVSVGAYAIIEEGAQIGDRCTIHAHAMILPNVELGEDNSVGHGAVIGGDP